jgi:hypothetical protein
MKELRNAGIYKLPDDNVYAVFSADKGKYLLYRCQHGVSNPPSYQTTPDGRILPWLGEGHEWKVEDLTDTGKTFDFPKGFNCPD